MARRPDYYTYRTSAGDAAFKKAGRLPAPVAFGGVSDAPVQNAVSTLKNGFGSALNELASIAAREEARNARLIAQAQAEDDKNRRDISRAKADTMAAEAFVDLEASCENDVEKFKSGVKSISDALLANVTDKNEAAERQMIFERRYRESLLRIKKAQADAAKKQTAADYSLLQRKNSDQAALAVRNGNAELAAELNKAAVTLEDMMILKGMATPVERARMIEDRQYNAELAGHYRNIDALKPRGVAEMEKYVKLVAEDNTLETQKRLRFVSALQQECDRQRAFIQTEGKKRNEQLYALERSIEAGYETNDDEVKAAQDEALAAGDTEHFKKLEIVRQVAQIANNVRRLAPEEQNALIARAVVHPETAVFDEKLNKSLRMIYANTLSELQSDPANVPVKAGWVSELSDFKPETIAGRVEEMKNAEARYGRKFPLFTKQEAKRLGMMVDAFETYSDRARVLGGLIQAAPSFYEDILSAVAPKNPEIAHAAQISNMGDDDTAQKILQGADVRKQTPEYAPQMDGNFKTKMAEMLPADVTRAMTPEFESGIKAAVLDYYAAVMRSRGDGSKKFDEDLLKEAVNKVTGGIVEYGGTWYGGGKKKTIAPYRGMAQDEFKAMVDNLSPSDFDGAFLAGNRFVADSATIGMMNFVSVGANMYAVDIRGQRLLSRDGMSEYIFSFPEYLADRVVAGEKIPDGKTGVAVIEQSPAMGWFDVKFKGDDGVVLDAGTFRTIEGAQQFAEAVRAKHPVPELLIAGK